MQKSLIALTVCLAGCSALLVFGPRAAYADELDGWCAQAKTASTVVLCSDLDLRDQAIARPVSRATAPRAAEDGFGRPDPLSPADALPPAPANPQSTGETTLDRWMTCLTTAVDVLASHSDPARTVAEAALGRCGSDEAAWESANSVDHDARDSIRRDAIIPRLLARVRAIRAQHVESSAPATWNPKLVKWADCTLSAVDALADQPEPAQAVVNAALGSCVTEELAYQKSTHISHSQMDEIKATDLFPVVLASVMAVRAARAKLRLKRSPD